MSRAAKNNYVKLEGSNKALPQNDNVETLNPDEIINVTIRIKRKSAIEDVLNKGKVISRKEYEEKYGASEKDISKVEAFIEENHLSVVEISKERRCIIVRGSINDLENAFHVSLSNYRDGDGNLFRGRSGSIFIPADLQDIIEAVIGLDDRIQVRPMFSFKKKDGKIINNNISSGFDPNALAKLYGFPKGVTGKGQTIAILELGGGYRTGDLTEYFKRLGIARPKVKAISVDGAHNFPTTADSADGEVMLDIEVAGVVANGAKIIVYFAPNNDQGFLNAITSAIHDPINRPSIISISWGSAEINWTEQSLNSYNEAFKTASLLGITVCAASGDKGTNDNIDDGKAHVDFPASSPYVLACGGTKCVADNKRIIAETVWNDSPESATGGGVSEFFPIPSYQRSAKVPQSVNSGFKGRGLPDVSANADPSTGYKILVDGIDAIAGGTSAVAPLMAGLIALMNEKKGAPAGFIHPLLYQNASLFCRDITKGNNITTSTGKGYKASKGWDACTGWGVMNRL